MADQDPDLVEGQDNPERPEWLPENFDSPESFAASYKEAQRKITELATEKRGLEESINSLSTQFEEFTAQQSRPDPSNVLGQWQDQYEADPFSTTLQLAEAIAQNTAQKILQQQQQPQAVDPDLLGFAANMTMAQQHEDWGEYVDKVKEVVSSDPFFANDNLWKDIQTSTQTLNNVYKMVKADALLSGAEVAQQQVADTRAMKLAAQSAAGASGRTPALPDDVQEWERIKNAGRKSYYDQ